MSNFTDCIFSDIFFN